MASSAKNQPSGSNNNNAATEEEESFSYALQIANFISMPMSMYAAVELGLFKIIAKAGPDGFSSEQISKQLSTNNPDAPTMLDRLLRLLASYGVVGCSERKDKKGNSKRLYSLTSVSKHYVPNQGAAFGPVLSMLQDKIFLDAWIRIKDAILEGGIPFNKAYGMDAFQYLRNDQRLNDVFNEGNVKGSTMIMKKILDIYGFDHNIGKLVDVGGGLGLTLQLIIDKYPSIKGINFDLPHVIQNAPKHSGIKHIGGDMFKSIPEGDVILMKSMLPGWGDEDCVKMLKNCDKAVKKNGKVIAINPVIPVVLEPSSSVQNVLNSDLLLMTLAPGGKERTEQEFRNLATKAGFRDVNFVCHVANHWVMEFVK